MRLRAVLLVVATVAVLAVAGTLATCTRSDAPQHLPLPPPHAVASAPEAASAAASAAASDALPAASAASTAAEPTARQRAAGETLARQGGQGPVGPIAACAGCHGTAGEGNAAAGFPRLAGQPWAYLSQALDAMAGGTRANAVMQPIARSLSADQRLAAAAWYASLPPAGPASSALPAAASASPELARGRTLAEAGDASKGVPACAGCHGIDGRGGPGPMPYLAGQPTGFLVASLQAWRDGTRAGDPGGPMPAVARALDEGDTHAVAAWLAALPPPALPRDQDAGPAPPSGPASALRPPGPH